MRMVKSAQDVREVVAQCLKGLSGGATATVPEGLDLFLSLFGEISAARTYHAHGPNPISFAEIEAFARLHRWPLCAHHVRIIKAIDDAWLEHARSLTGEEPVAPRHSGPAQEMTAHAFDAVFA